MKIKTDLTNGSRYDVKVYYKLTFQAGTDFIKN